MNSNDPTHLGTPGHILGDHGMDTELAESDDSKALGSVVMELIELAAKFRNAGDTWGAAEITDFAMEASRRKKQAQEERGASLKGLDPVMAAMLSPFVKVGK